MLLRMLLISIVIVSCNGESDNNDKKERTTTSGSANYYVNQNRSTETRSVTEKYGDLEIKEGEFIVESDIRPWSAWWYPSRDTSLFRSSEGLAPLEKYDNFSYDIFNIDARSAEYEEEYIYNEGEANWSGLCHAWAVASVLYKEPKYIANRGGIDFSVGDQKALLIKSYANVSNLTIFGDRYDGHHEDNFEDVYPEQFHRFAVEWLENKNKPFLMDYDPSYPVWTVPVNKVKFIITKEDNQTAFVKAWVQYATPFVFDQNYVGTKYSNKAYTYRLYGDFSGSTMKVVDSEWVEDSIDDHPDYVIEYPENANRGTFNQELQIKVIDEIVRPQRL